MIVAFVDEHRNEFGVEFICRQRSGKVPGTGRGAMPAELRTWGPAGAGSL